MSTISINPGWRARIGVLWPETGNTDDELWGFVPSGVAVHLARTLVDGPASVEVLKAMAVSENTERLAEGLGKIDVDVVTYACTAAGFIRGHGGDAELNSRLSDAAGGIPASNAATATVNALNSLSLERISIASPYIGEIDVLLSEFLDASGFKIIRQQNLGIHGPDLGHISLEEAARLVRQVNSKDCDGVYVACTGIRSLPIIDALEEDLGKPIVSALQATMWEALHLSGVQPNVNGLGRLFASPYVDGGRT